MMRRLLVPLDGSEFSEHALPLAASLARGGGLGLRLLHVHQPLATPSLALRPTAPASLDAVDAEARTAAEHYLAVCAERLDREAGVRAEIGVVIGPLTSALVAAVHDSGADMVVMTTHGRGGLARAWMGSTADGLVRQAGVPILLVRPAPRPPALDRRPECSRILVPLDGSELSERVLPHAREIARLTGASLTLLSVVVAAGAGAAPLADASGYAGSMTDAAQNYLETVRQRLPDGLDVALHACRASSAAAGILHTASGSGADVVCMATHGRGGLKRALLGSVADKVMRSCQLPILLYRPT